MPVYRFVSEELDDDVVLAVGDIQAEGSLFVGGGAGNLYVLFHRHDRGVCYGFSLFVLDRSCYGRLFCGKSLGGNECRCKQTSEKLFHCGGFVVLFVI